jgi:hypothetical protein
MEQLSVGYALLAVQRALLGEVTPQLRAVIVDVKKESELLYIRFYYDGEISEKRLDLWDCAISEAHAALAHVCCSLDGEVERLDYPKQIPVRGRLAYLRKEVNVLENPFISPASLKIQRNIVDFKETIGVFLSPVDSEQVDTSWGVIHYGPDGCHIVHAKPKEYPINIFPLAYGLLAIQRAILGTVIPELRCIVADISQDGPLLYIRFYYDGVVSYETVDDWETAITESIADLGQDYSLDAEVVRLDYSQKIPFRGRYAYSRKE